MQNIDILSLVREQFRSGPPKRLGVAVSGGGDSIALLHILTRCFDPSTVELFAATVDHRLRPEAAGEAALVADLCEHLGVTHSTLTWRGWDGSGNLQDQARAARYQLLADWAKQLGINDVAVGHTANDQAETVLMRLGRAAGVSGLSGMPVRRTMNGITLVRPMLRLERAQLRDYLRENAVGWIEDPSNEDLRYDRIKARHALEALAPLGITSTALAQVARNMEQAREALDWYSFLAARDIVHVDGGNVLMEVRRLRTLPDDIARRLITRAVEWIGQSDYPPRHGAMAAVMDAIASRKSTTLAGCRVVHQGGYLWICREHNAVRDMVVGPNKIWDSRWRISGPRQTGYTVRALGRAGIQRCDTWRATKRPHAALLASPSVWTEDKLVAAPLAGMAEGWSAELIGGGEEYYAALLTH